MESIKLAEIRTTAENYYRDGDYYCSESVLKTLRDAFQLSLPDEIIAMASGFPVGMGGSGCTCGAVSGGVMALGMFFGRTAAKDPQVDKCMQLSKELHDTFRANHKKLCCRALIHDMVPGSDEHMQQCIALTGEVAETTAKIVARELSITVI